MSRATPAQPQATTVSKPFWEQANQERLLLQVSTATGKAQFIPRPYGLELQDTTEWQIASGLGSLLAVTICRVAGPGYEDSLPYAMGIVKLAEGPRVLARIVAPDLARLKVGMRVRLGWDATRGEQKIYVFEPA